MNTTKYSFLIIVSTGLFLFQFGCISRQHKLGTEALRQGDYQTALKFLEEARSFDPELNSDEKFRSKLASARKNACKDYIKQANQALELYNYRKAVLLADKALNALPSSKDAKNVYLLAQAKLFFADKQYEKSLDCLNKLPQDGIYSYVPQYINRTKNELFQREFETAKILFARKEHSRAKVKFQKACQNNPDNLEARDYLTYYKARDLVYTGKLTSALKTLKTLIDRNPDMPEANRLYKQISGHKDQAEQFINEALSLRGQKKYIEARDKVVKALRIHPSSSDGRRVYYMILSDLGKQIENRYGEQCAWAWFGHLEKQFGKLQKTELIRKNYARSILTKMKKKVIVATPDNSVPEKILGSIRDVLNEGLPKVLTVTLDRKKSGVMCHCKLKVVKNDVGTKLTRKIKRHTYPSGKKKVLKDEYTRACQDVENAKERFRSAYDNLKDARKEYYRSRNRSRSGIHSAEDNLESARRELRDTKKRKGKFGWFGISKYTYKATYSTVNYRETLYTKKAECEVELVISDSSGKTLLKKIFKGSDSASDTYCQTNSKIGLSGDPLRLPGDSILQEAALNEVAKDIAPLLTGYFKQYWKNFVYRARHHVGKDQTGQAITEYVNLLMYNKLVSLPGSYTREAERFILNESNLSALVRSLK